LRGVGWKKLTVNKEENKEREKKLENSRPFTWKKAAKVV
jgi:hypothetical protein